MPTLAWVSPQSLTGQTSNPTMSVSLVQNHDDYDDDDPDDDDDDGWISFDDNNEDDECEENVQLDASFTRARALMASPPPQSNNSIDSIHLNPSGNDNTN